jgi:hypothetical protein
MSVHCRIVGTEFLGRFATDFVFMCGTSAVKAHDKPALAFFRWVPRAVPEEVGRKIPIVKASASHRKKCRGPVTAAVVEVSTMSRARQAKRAVAAWRPQRSGRQTRPGAKLASMMCSTTLPRGDLCVSRTGSCSTASAATPASKVNLYKRAHYPLLSS